MEKRRRERAFGPLPGRNARQREFAMPRAASDDSFRDRAAGSTLPDA